MLPIRWADDEWVLLPERAVYWPAGRAIIVADLHLGKAASFRAAGVPVPDGCAHSDLARLSMLIDRHDATHAIILGDLLHNRAARSIETLAALAAWRARHASIAVTLVRGNHDYRSGDPPAELEISVVPDGHLLDGAHDQSRRPLMLCHDPSVAAEVTGRRGVRSPSSGDAGVYALAGHVHPAVALRHPSGLSGMRTRCFWFSGSVGVLPAFGGFTGTAVIRPVAGDRIFAVGDDAVVDVTPAPARAVVAAQLPLGGS